MKLKATLTILAGLLTASCATAQTADEILERNFAALGGRAKLRAVRTLRLEATQVTGDKSVPLKTYWKRPDKLRIESAVDGLDVLQVFDGEKGWYTYSALPGFGVEYFTDLPLQALQAQADLLEGPTFDYAAKGHRVELIGKEKLNGGEAWRLLLTTAKGEVRTLWFDTNSMLQIREERKELREGLEVTIESTLSDFRPVGGILFAHRVEERMQALGKAGGETSVEKKKAISIFTIQKLELDADVPDSLFNLPAPAEPSQSAEPPPV